jgi:hypothetical protein
MVFVRSKAWVCGRSFIGIADSNPAGDVDVFFSLVSVVCCHSETSASDWITRPEEPYRAWCVCDL